MTVTEILMYVFICMLFADGGSGLKYVAL